MHAFRSFRRALACLLAVCASAASAQAWPSKPLTIIVPFGAGSGNDQVARLIGQELATSLGQPVVIENKAGAGGNIGAAAAAKAAPDGYTLFMGAVHHSIAPSMYPRLDYNIETDLVPLILVASVPQVVVVNPKNVTAPDFKSFLAHIRANPAKLNYGSAGSGTSHHLAGELFKQQTKTFITHIPYRGAGPALADLIAGNVDMMFDGLGSSAGHIKGGRIKPMMVSGTKRNPAFPDVPCASEVGLPEYNVTTWYGVWAPKGTPADAQARAIEEIRKACTTDEAKAVWAAQGADFPDLTGPAFGQFVSAEVRKWAQVVKTSGAKLE